MPDPTERATASLPSPLQQAIEVRVATGADTRDSLLAAFCHGGHERVADADVVAAIDEAIAQHNAHTPAASGHAIALLDALEELPARGVVTSFAHGVGEASAFEAIGRAAARLMGGAAGHAPVGAAGSRTDPAELWGYAWSDVDDAAALVTTGRLALHYGVFAEAGRRVDDAATTLRRVLAGHGFAVVDHDPQAQLMTFGPIDYRMPFHGYGLSSPADPDPV